jgi:glycosyltransferase involved in cell wall biosynthesis
VTGAAATYTASDLAILVPTKDRPQKIRNLLDSIAVQSARPGRIIIIDGGESIRDLVRSYDGALAVEHHVCQPPGQIRQRNMGIGLLDDRTPLVASLDDDIVLEPGAIEAMIAHWNRVEPNAAGIGFNIINTPPDPRSWFRDVFLLSAPGRGRVLPSGMNTSYNGATGDQRTEWLCGGATVWRRELLQAQSHRELPGQWAIGEDVIFSYPVGRKRPLYACAAARVRHEHVFDYGTRQAHRFHGLTRTLWVFYFVEANRELSRLAFLWSTAGSIGGRLLGGILTANREHLEFALGQAEGVAKGLWSLARHGDVTRAIEREAARR